jgi:PAS domain S-box-containing protein
VADVKVLVVEPVRTSMSEVQQCPRIVVAVGDEALRTRVERKLAESDSVERDGLARVETAAAAVEVAAEERVDCVVAADDLPDWDAPAVLGGVESPVVALQTDEADAPVAGVLDAGATDVVTVDDSNRFDRIGDRVANAVAWRRARDEAVGRISAALKKRAMDEAPVGITVADFTLPDNPLVYVNDRFEELTGYPADEALGRNCRYLQGPATDPDSVAELRRAIRAGEATSVELQNYRRDGTSFWNRVDIAPLRNDAGEVTHYVGFQTDITDRVLAEEAAERYAAAVDRERERLRRLVDHIEGMLEDVTEVLVRAETRADLERGVVEQITATETYHCAWIDDCSPTPESITPSVRAGEPEASVVGLRIDSGTPDDPVARAVATRTVQSVSDRDGRFHRETVVPFGGVVAVPLVHRDTLYGVLVVYTDGEAVSEEETVVLGTVGRAVGAAVDAFESRRTLLTDNPLELRIEVADPELPLAALAGSASCRLEYEGSVARDDGRLLLFVSSTPPDATFDGEATSDLEDVRPLDREGDAGLFQVVLPPGSLLARVAEEGGRLVDVVVDPSTEAIELTVTVQNRTAARDLPDDVETVARGVRLRSIREQEGPHATHREFVSGVEHDLTDRQRTALQLAHLGGFFEWPHDVSGEELAEAMEITRSTFHQHLRAAERKLVSRFFGDAPD